MTDAEKASEEVDVIPEAEWRRREQANILVAVRPSVARWWSVCPVHKEI
jgi:hypothetical protein